MTDYSQHPMRQDGERFVGPDLNLKNQQWFIRQPPDVRRQYLTQIEMTVSAPDGTALRKKAQIMRDFQTLNQIDKELRALSR
jgi:hypothetical protein